MKVSREQANENRERVLDVASQLFRQHGFDGISVAELMKGAGLTHGGFYGNFSSKEDLMAQTCARSLARSAEKWNSIKSQAQDVPQAALAGLAENYMSSAHRDNPGRGCAIAALGSDLARQSAPVREAADRGARELIAILAQLQSGETEAIREEKAMAAFAGMVGGIVLARLIDEDEYSQRIIKAVAAALQAPVPR